MKKIYSLLYLLFVGVNLIYTSSSRYITVTSIHNDTDRLSLSSVDSVLFSQYGDTVYAYLNGIRVKFIAPIDVSVTFSKDTTISDSVIIMWKEEDVEIRSTYPDSILDISLIDGHVIVKDSSIHDYDISYYLYGECSDGSLNVYSSNNFNLNLNNVNLTNPHGPAINSQSNNKMAVHVPMGSISSLNSGERYTMSYEDRKGTVFSEGPIIFTGLGTLNVSSLEKHSICSDSYILVDGCHINVDSAKGDAFHANDSIILEGGFSILHSNSDAIHCDGSVYIRDGNIECFTNGNGAKGIKAGKNIFISGGTVDINQSGNYVINDSAKLSFCTGIKADSIITVSDGTINITSSACGGRGLSSDSLIYIRGGNVSVNLSGSGGLVSMVDTFTSCCLKCDKDIMISAGAITLKNIGSVGTKGIKCDGSLVIGSEDHDGPNLTVETKGDAVYYTGAGKSVNYYGTPKAIEARGKIVVNSGIVLLSTLGIGGEGMESLTSIRLNGGYLYSCSDKDDAINSKGIIHCNGSYVYAVSKNNDAIDSDFMGDSAVTISNGIVIAISLFGGSEEAIDCDAQDIKIKGGYLFAAGGSSGDNEGEPIPGGDDNPLIITDNYLVNETLLSHYRLATSSNEGQQYSKLSNFPIEENTYYLVTDASNNVIFCFYSKDALSATNNVLSLISAPIMQKGQNFKIRKSNSAPTRSTYKWDGYVYLGGNVSSPADVITFTVD